jgi:hypothetical protein
MWVGKDEAIRLVSCDIGKNLLRSLKPEILAQFPEIERRAFPRGLEDFKLGPSIYADILREIFQTLRTKGEVIDKVSTLEDVAMIILEDLFSRLSQLELKGELEPKRVANELEKAFTEHPSLLDRVSIVVQPSFEIKVEKLQQIERMLESYVLKVIDDKGTISTAFALCQRRHILTAAHVALDEKNKPRSLKLAFRYGDVRARGETPDREATVIYSDTSIDIALLQLAIQHWQEFRRCGLLGDEEDMKKVRVRLALRDENSLRGHPVLCFGYQAQPTREGHRFIDPCPVRATVARHKPVRNIEFVDEITGRVTHTQPCLVVIVAEGEERIGHGMSGGPILDLETGEIIAMITGAQRLGRIHQPYKGGIIEEQLPLAEYGFGVLLSDVVESWPEFRECCLAQQKS